MLRTLTKVISFTFFMASPLLAQTINVAKDANCGCCGAWIEDMQQAGFEMNARNVAFDALAELKVSLGISEDMTSCHTAIVEGYFIEGHVPASEIARLLAERPEALGLAVPNMPLGSPGMDFGSRKDAYDVFLILPDGSPEVFASYSGS